MRKYVVEVRLWTKQMRPGGRSGEYEMTLEEAEALIVRLRDKGVSKDDIRINTA